MSAFRDQNYLFEEANAQVLGVSGDSFAAVGEFEAKLSTGFPLLSDFPRKQAGRDYGTHTAETGVHRRLTVVLDLDRIVRGIVYAEFGDYDAHPAKALEILAGVARRSA